MRDYIIVPAAALVCLPLASHAEGSGVEFSSEIVIELQNDYNFDSDDPTAELNDTFFTIEGAFGLSFGAGSSVNASTVIEPLRDPTGDRFVEDHGLYFEELYYAQEFRGVEFVLGKFNPLFGTAWDVAPGIYGVDFAEDYEITERLGVAVNVPVFGDAHVLQFAVFQADRTILSDSFGFQRGQTNISAGGVSNTNGLRSFSASLNGEFGATTYNVGLQHQEAGTGDAKEQQGIAAGLTHTISNVELLGEVIYFEGFDGTTADAFYFTAGASVPIGPVSVSGVYSLRDIDNAPTDNLFTVSGEVEILDNVSASLGYRFGDEGGVDTQTLGTLIVVEF